MPAEISPPEASPPGAEDRLRAIAAITDSTIGDLDVDDLLKELLDRVVGLLEADTAAVLLLDDSGTQLVARAASGIEEEVRQGVRVEVGVGFAGTIAARREPVMLERVTSDTVWNPLLWRRGIQTMLGVPLEGGSRLLGVLHVGRLSARPFTQVDADLLLMVGSRVAAAVQARELEIERAAGRVLQRSLLPSALPTCPGMEFATRYVPAEFGGVGGDWYDAFRLPTGELWIMAGDVAGHGLSPAVTMGRLRAALRSYALDGKPPDRVLALADRKIQFFDPGQTATVVCARLLPPYDEMMMASAGHLPPVLARPNDEPELLDLPVTPPLGIMPIERTAATVSLPPGSVLLAYTDGLVERRGEPLDVGLERLRQVVSAEHPELVCRRVMEVLMGDQPPGDDVAVIAMRRATP